MKTKNVLLINPWIYDFSAYDYWMKPLGLLYMASYIREGGLNVRFIDCLNPRLSPAGQNGRQGMPRRKPGGHGKFLKEVVEKPEVLQHIPKQYHRYGIHPVIFEEILRQGPEPDLILVTAMMTYWYPGAFAVIKLVRKHFPHAPIILGGNYVTLCPEHARKSGADFLLAGNGEQHIPFIIEELMGTTLLGRPDLHDLNELPYPAFDLLGQPDQVPLLTSRGCPFRCPYCASPLLQRHFIRRDPLKVADEIEHWIKNLGIHDFSYYDDALLSDPAMMAIPLLREIIRRGLGCRFHCPNGLHLREVTSELASLMFNSGFQTLRFGFETSDLQRQREMGGKVENTHLDAAVAYLLEAGYATRDIGIYLLCGLPGQTEKDVHETIRYVQSLGARPILAEFSPIPGTELWPAAVEASPFPLTEEPLFHNNSLLPCRSESLTLTHYHELKRMTRGFDG